MYEREFKITEDKPYIEREWGKVYCLYDAPHLLKSIRNNLMKHNAMYKGKICSFRHIEKLYYEDIKTQPRSVPKLKEDHIKLAQFAEMSVSKAAIVLSHSVSAGLKSYVSTGKLPQEALNTSQYCYDFDCLFDIANSSVFNTTKDLKRPVKSNSKHLKFLEDMRKPLRNMYFVEKACFSAEEESQFKPLVKQSRKPYCLEGWLLYISSLLQLWNELSTTHQFNFLRTRNLQQDCLEHFFSIIRWKNINNNHPDPARFMSAYKSVVINQLIVPNKLGNVEADISKYILNSEEIHKIGFIKSHSPREKYHHVNFDSNQADNSQPDENQLSSIYWTTGWVCSQLQHEDCFDRITAGNQNLPENVTFLTDLKRYDSNSNIVSPNQHAFDYFRGICKTFDENFTILLEESPIGVKEELFDIIRVEFDYPSHSDETLSEPLVCGILCEACANRVTDKYLNMLIKCKLNNMNVTFKTENEQKKTSKRNQKSAKLNIARYRNV